MHTFKTICSDFCHSHKFMQFIINLGFAKRKYSIEICSFSMDDFFILLFQQKNDST